MARFSYTAEKTDGEIYKGLAEAQDRFELYQIVRREGGKILSLEEDSGRNYTSFAYWNAKFSSVKEYDKVLFARNLGAMLGAGLSLARALAVLERQTKNPRLSVELSHIASDIRHGDTLHQALAKFPRTFSKLFVAMVRAGEEGGDVAESLKAIAEQTERMYNLKKKIRGALLYPCIVLVAIVGIGILMMIEVVPTLAQTFAELDAELPRSTQAVIGASNFLVAHTILALALMLGVIGALYAGVKTRAGSRVMDYVLLHLPMVGVMVREVNAARTSRTLASLSASGVDILTALEISREVVQNSFFQEVLSTARTNVQQGSPLSTAFIRREDLYPAFVGEMMAVGEETGQTAEMLQRLSLYYEDEVDRKTKDMSTIIEPFLMVFIGAAVGFFAISMIAPIYQLSEHI